MNERLSSPFEKDRPSHELGFSKQIIELVRQHIEAVPSEYKTSMTFTSEIEPATDAVGEMIIDIAATECARAARDFERARIVDHYKRYELMGGKELADLAAKSPPRRHLTKATYDDFVYPNAAHISQLTLRLARLYEKNEDTPYGQQAVIKCTYDSHEEVLQIGLSDGSLTRLVEGFGSIGEGEAILLQSEVEESPRVSFHPSFKHLNNLITYLKELPPYTL